MYNSEHDWHSYAMASTPTTRIDHIVQLEGIIYALFRKIDERPVKIWLARYDPLSAPAELPCSPWITLASPALYHGDAQLLAVDSYTYTSPINGHIEKRGGYLLYIGMIYIVRGC